MRYIGPPLREAFADLLETKDAATIEEAVRSYSERFSTVGLFENAVYPGVERVLEQLGADGFALGDREHDILGAVAQGVAAIGVT